MKKRKVVKMKTLEIRKYVIIAVLSFVFFMVFFALNANVVRSTCACEPITPIVEPTVSPTEEVQPTVEPTVEPTIEVSPTVEVVPTATPEAKPEFSGVSDGRSDGKSDGKSSCPECTQAPVIPNAPPSTGRG